MAGHGAQFTYGARRVSRGRFRLGGYRDVVGDSKGTLGILLPKLDLPKPLDAAVDKLWGFASDKARHVREGDQLDNLQAELVVSVACSICIFLAKRAPDKHDNSIVEDILQL
jgi:hypothetical protein